MRALEEMLDGCGLIGALRTPVLCCDLLVSGKIGRPLLWLQIDGGEIGGALEIVGWRCCVPGMSSVDTFDMSQAGWLATWWSRGILGQHEISFRV